MTLEYFTLKHNFVKYSKNVLSMCIHHRFQNILRLKWTKACSWNHITGLKYIFLWDLDKKFDFILQNHFQY